MNTRTFFIGRVVGFLVVLLVVGIVWYFKSATPVLAPTETSTATASPVAGTRTFTSTGLGISFQYLDYQPGWAATHVQHIGDKIYLAVGGAAITTGQSVQVFTKPADQSLADAIKQQILASYPSPDCTVTVAPSNIIGGYQVAEIGYPPPTDSNAPYWDNAAKCNETYAKTNGIRYFLYDPKHPTKFAFLDIGQYAILAHDMIPWQDTLTFQ